MGFNKVFVPSISIVSSEVYDYGVDWVIQKYTSADMMMGDPESISYIYRLIESQKENAKY